MLYLDADVIVQGDAALSLSLNLTLTLILTLTLTLTLTLPKVPNTAPSTPAT